MTKKVKSDSEELAKVEKIARKSKLTQKDADEIADLIKKEIWEDLEKELAKGKKYAKEKGIKPEDVQKAVDCIRKQ